MKNKELELAINNNDLKYIIALFEEGDFSNECLDNNGYNSLDYALQNIYERNGSLEIVYTLLQKGINTNFLCDEKSTPLHTALWYEDWLNSEIFLKYGSNPNITADETESTILASENNLDMTRILLNYGALYNLGIPNMYLETNTLHNSVRQGNLNMIQLLLDYGADPMSSEGCYMLVDEEIYRDILFDDVDISTEEFDELKRLLNSNNHPYLKIEESKYIIYENELLNREGYTYAKPYLLTDKKKHKDKRYLYANNKIDAFIYWSYKHELLTEAVMKVIDKYVSMIDATKYTKLSNLLIDTLGEQLTTDYFTEDGKAFATSYLTTHWWYNLHTDFNRLYQDEDNKLPRAVKSQKEFDTLLKLLDIRFEQFKSGKDFNSNQNKEELECLIEGREARPRHVQLSELESQYGREEKKASDNIIPDDFMS